MEQRRQRHGWNGHFLGHWARVNCESIPVIPAWLVRSNLDDPRRLSYLLIWKDERHDGRIMETLRLSNFAPCGRECNNYAELKRPDGSVTTLRIMWRTLPRNGGRALFLLCPCCNTPRRFVYGWEWDSFSGWSNRVRSISWRCRSCAQLRYSSEGGALLIRGRGALWRLVEEEFGPQRSDRPEPWLPLVFTSPSHAVELGLIKATD